MRTRGDRNMYPMDPHTITPVDGPINIICIPSWGSNFNGQQSIYRWQIQYMKYVQHYSAFLPCVECVGYFLPLSHRLITKVLPSTVICGEILMTLKIHGKVFFPFWTSMQKIKTTLFLQQVLDTGMIQIW